MATILAIDDEKDILALIKNALRKEGYQVLTAISAEEVNQNLLMQADLILLDVMMPGTDGFELCRNIRSEVDCPILFLTAKSLEEDVAFGFSLGADEYIKKPFSLIELRARVAAHLRREQRERTQILTIGNIRFFLQSRKIFVNKKELSFTKSEYTICELLVKHRPQVFSKEQIYESVFGFDGESDDSTIKEHVKNIRKKFEIEGEAPIDTVWGIGYRWK